MRVSEGKPCPLGATADATGANFAVFSAQATRVDVRIFDAPNGREVDRLPRSPELSGWNRLMDTNNPGLPGHVFRFGHVCKVAGRSMLLFERKAPKKRTRPGAP